MKNPRLIDMTGQRFGEWLVLHQEGNNPRGGALWRCRCSCGTESVTLGKDLRDGKSTRCKPCGTRSHMTTHGGTGSRLYRIWKQMRTRCTNPKAPGYKNYGGRGISICPQWSSFPAFRQWAESSGYRDDLSIERNDNDGDYEPANCSWADRTTQARNRRFVAKAPDGRPWSVVARENGITMPAYRTRLSDGWDHETAATWPMHKRRQERARDEFGRYA